MGCFCFYCQEVVAIDQVGGAAGFGTVPVDVAKLNAADAADSDEDIDYAIAVAIGGTGVATPSKTLITYSAEDNAIYVTFMNGAETVDSVATVGGKAVLTATVPTLAADPAYATTAYTFVGWVDADGNAVTAETPIAGNTTAYAKFQSNYTTGDVTGDKKVIAKDRGMIHNFIKTGANADTVKIKVSHLLPDTVVTGDVTGDGKVIAKDRGMIHNFIKTGANADSVNVPIYVVNK